MELIEEEKKALEIFKEIKDVRGIRQDVEGENEDLWALDIVSNLIDKKQKEIEEYKKFKKDIVSKIMIWDKEELPDNERIIEMIDTLISEVSRLEDIEDKKVKVAVDFIEEKRDKEWKDKIKEKIKEYDKWIKQGEYIESLEAQKYALNELLEEN